MRKIALLTAVSALTMPRAFANPGGASGPRVEPQLTGVVSLKLPERQSRRGSVSSYPFDTLANVGDSFGVKNKSAKQLSSIVSNQNKKHVKPVLDAAGNPTFNTKEITAADGTKTNVPDSASPITAPERKFIALDVTDDMRKLNKEAFAKGGAMEGVTAIISRTV